MPVWTCILVLLCKAQIPVWNATTIPKQAAALLLSFIHMRAVQWYIAPSQAMRAVDPHQEIC